MAGPANEDGARGAGSPQRRFEQRYRRALEARRTTALHAGDEVAVLPPAHGRKDVLTFTRGDLTVVLNCGDSPAPLPAGEVVIASGPLEGGVLPPDTAAWLR